MEGAVAMVCIDIPFCWRHMYTGPNLAWAQEIPCSTKRTVCLARSVTSDPCDNDEVFDAECPPEAVEGEEEQGEGVMATCMMSLRGLLPAGSTTSNSYGTKPSKNIRFCEGIKLF